MAQWIAREALPAVTSCIPETDKAAHIHPKVPVPGYPCLLLLASVGTGCTWRACTHADTHTYNKNELFLGISPMQYEYSSEGDTPVCPHSLGDHILAKTVVHGQTDEIKLERIRKCIISMQNIECRV